GNELKPLFRPRLRGHRVDGNRVKRALWGNSEDSAPTDIVDPGAIVGLDFEARPSCRVPPGRLRPHGRGCLMAVALARVVSVFESAHRYAQSPAHRERAHPQ